MKTFEQRVYLTPKIEVNEIEVEQGFTLSNMENVGNAKPEQSW